MPSAIQSELKRPLTSSSWSCAFFNIIAVLLTTFAFSPDAGAVCQEGCGLNNENTFLGNDALLFNTAGILNTAVGHFALRNTTSGFSNTAVGASALALNSVGEVNTGSGAGTLFFNTTGSNNTASGGSALFHNTTGNDNSASGVNALFSNNEGNKNVAVGKEALFSSTTGSSNIALGESAGNKLTTGSNNIYIGHPGGSSEESNKIRIGTTGTQKNAFIAGIFGVTVGTGVGVIVNSNGRLGTVTSSARFKEKIQPMDKTSEAILALEPVTFRYKHEFDAESIPQFGLVAEEVAKIDPHLVVCDGEGQPYTVRYEAVNAMLLNEFLKEHRRFEEQAAKVKEQESRLQNQESRIAQQESANTAQEKMIQSLTTSLREQAAEIQEVSARLEARKSSPRLVVSNQ